MTPAEVNARGNAGSWRAKLLQTRAWDKGETMAAAWRRDVAQSVALSVPAQCIGVSARFVSYRFADGSTDSYERP